MSGYGPFIIGAVIGMCHLVWTFIGRPIEINHPFQGLAVAALAGSIVVGWPLYLGLWLFGVSL